MTGRARPPEALPDRIWVVGPCGAGKSAVARRLAHVLGVEPVHLDDLHWRPGWTEAEPAEEAAALARRLRAPRWVVDGNYGPLRRSHRARTDFYVWLDLPLTVTMPRLLKRSIARSLLDIPCCNGNRESLVRTFLSRDSILLWGLTSDRPRRTQLEVELADRPHVRLTHPAAIRRWLARLARVAAGVSAAARPGRS